MLDGFDFVGKMIQSPPGQLVAGATLGGAVRKSFEKFDAFINEDTRLSIAVWLLDQERKFPESASFAETVWTLFRFAPSIISQPVPWTVDESVTICGNIGRQLKASTTLPTEGRSQTNSITRA